MGTQLPLPYKDTAPIIGQCPLWPNGWVDYDVAWYRSRRRPRRHSVGTQLPPEKGHTYPNQFLVHVYCGQTAGWIKIPLGTEVNLGPADVVLDGVAASP